MNVNVPIEELRRLVAETEEAMPPDLAGIVMHLHPTPAELARVEELLRVSKSVGLKGAEYDEFAHFVELNDLLAVLKLRAKRTLRSKATSRAPAEVAA